jgi:lipopolysaccharide transport system ATP-binding protein
MGDFAIQAYSLGKQYRIGAHPNQRGSLRSFLGEELIAPWKRLGRLLRGQAHAATNANEPVWVLREVSFEVRHGEVLGIIGHNGAGKSTLLKILSRITEPSEGYAKVYGRVGALLEIGTGFHPDLTGRENVYLNAAILGMKRGEIDRKFDEIVDFSGVEKFIDTPVKHYSSGMQLRLGFAVAAYLEPDIMVIDEVLAVGDLEFQKKCLGKMSDVASAGRTVLFVSHNLAAVQRLCPRSLLLKAGRLEMDGATHAVLERYQAYYATASYIPLEDREDRSGDGRLRFTQLRVMRSKDNPGESPPVSGQDLTLAIAFKLTSPHPPQVVRFIITFADMYGNSLFTCNTQFKQVDFPSLPQKGILRCHIPRLPLASGTYSLNLSAFSRGRLLDQITQAARIDVLEGDFFGTGQLSNPQEDGWIVVDHRWELEGGDEA